MRVTMGQSLRNLQKGASSAASRIALLTQQLSTGRLLTRPSDNPVAIPNVLLSRAAVDTAKVRQDAVSAAKQWVQASDDTLGDVSAALQRCCDIGILAHRVAAGETVNASLAAEVRDLREHLIAVGNTQQSGKYLFAGQDTRTKPFEVAADGTVTYMGDSGDLLVSVAAGRSLSYNVTGDRVFNMNGATDAGLPDVFAAMENLAAAIESGSVGLTDAAATNIDKLLGLVLDEHAATGVAGQRVEWAASHIADEVLRCQSYLSEVEDTDLVGAVSDYRTAEVAYQAVIYATNRVSQLPTLFELM